MTSSVRQMGHIALGGVPPGPAARSPSWMPPVWVGFRQGPPLEPPVVSLLILALLLSARPLATRLVAAPPVLALRFTPLPHSHTCPLAPCHTPCTCRRMQHKAAQERASILNRGAPSLTGGEGTPTEPACLTTPDISHVLDQDPAGVQSTPAGASINSSTPRRCRGRHD